MFKEYCKILQLWEPLKKYKKPKNARKNVKSWSTLRKKFKKVILLIKFKDEWNDNKSKKPADNEVSKIEWVKINFPNLYHEFNRFSIIQKKGYFD